MDHLYENMLSPVGVVPARMAAIGGKSRATGRRAVIGLIDNSKPNVAAFLDTLADELRRAGEFDVVNVTKPRSAAPTPDLAALAAQCDYVVNAIAD